MKVAVAAALVALAAAALYVALWRPPGVVGPAPNDGFVRVPGVVHVHTKFSDGAGSPDDVVRAARATGTKFIVITDHNTVDAKSFGGYHDGVLVIAGAELSTTNGHMLGLGLEDPVYRFSGDSRDGLEDIRDLGGLSVAAHPMSPRADLQFTGWDLPGPWGVSIGLRAAAAAEFAGADARPVGIGCWPSGTSRALAVRMRTVAYCPTHPSSA